MSTDPIQQVKVAVSVKEGTDWNAKVLSEVSIHRTIAGHELSEGAEPLENFVEILLGDVRQLVQDELDAQAKLAQARATSERLSLVEEL